MARERKINILKLYEVIFLPLLRCFLSNLLVDAGFTSMVYPASCLFVMYSCDKCSFKKFLFEWTRCFCLNPRQRCCRLSDSLSEYRFHLDLFTFRLGLALKNDNIQGFIWFCFGSQLYLVFMNDNGEGESYCLGV